MRDLDHLKVAVLATDGAEETELLEPAEALRRAGAQVELIAPELREIQCMRGIEKARRVPADRALSDAAPSAYDALLLPGGALCADALRSRSDVLQFVREIEAAGKPIAALGHAPWILISAGLVRGRQLTSHPAMQDDVRNASGQWIDRAVIIDGLWVSGRGHSDLPLFAAEMVELFSRATPPVIQVAESA